MPSIEIILAVIPFAAGLAIGFVFGRLYQDGRKSIIHHQHNGVGVPRPPRHGWPQEPPIEI